MNTVVMPRPRMEIIAIIVLLSPLETFRHIQIAHQSCCMTPAQQFMVRRRHRRTMCMWSALYFEKLSNGRDDGVSMSIFHEVYGYGMTAWRMYYVNGVEHGTHIGWHASRHMRFRSTLVHGKRHGLYTEWYSNGALRLQCTYVEDKACDEPLTWVVDGTPISRDTVFRDGEYALY